MPLQDTSNVDLLARYGQLLVTDHQGRMDNEGEKVYAEIVERMRPDGPPKTEETILGALSMGDRFLGDVSHMEYLVFWDKPLGRLRVLDVLNNEALADYHVLNKVHKIIT